MFSWNRRQLLMSGLGGLCGWLGAARVQALSATLAARARRCVVLWMEGGPSQLDTFDPKPGMRTGGPVRSISTSVAGIRISEYLPQIARHMDKLAIVRNLASTEGDHDRGDYTMHTGYSPVPSFPRPAVGSIVSRHTPATEIPKYVSIGSRAHGPAYMGPDHAPFVIEDSAQAEELLHELRRKRNQLSLVSQLSAEFEASHPEPLVQRRQAMLKRVERIVTTNFMDALNLELEPKSSRERYGDSDFAQQCLLARRLLESGVNFVEVRLGGWDTHSDNFNAVKDLCDQLDRPWATLMEDLSASGLLDETLVLWMGEFGRTPIINGANGRDHFPDVTPVVMGGAGLNGGLVVGQTNREGAQIDGQAYRVADLVATILNRFDIQPNTQFTTSFGSPTSATDQGQPIKELI